MVGVTAAAETPEENNYESENAMPIDAAAEEIESENAVDI